MGEKMVLNEDEVKTCIEFALQPFLKRYEIVIKESRLKIDEDIDIFAVMTYSDYTVDLSCHFQLKYEKQCLIFENITGKVEYLFLQFQMMSFLKQFLHDQRICFEKNQIRYHIDLPIASIITRNQQLDVQIKNNQSLS